MWWNGHASAMARAEQALTKASETATAQAVLAAQVGSHLAECSRSNADRESKEREARLETQRWREGLGERLDRQDRQLRMTVITGLTAMVTVLMSVVGFLVQHYVIK